MKAWIRRGIAVAALLLAAGPSPAANAPTTTAAAPAMFLRQAWSEADRSWFYAVSQGSQIMPYAWFMSLERPDSEDLFVSDSLTRFGYLADPYRRHMPATLDDRLPIGFTKDVDDRGEWIGMTCSACHTGRVEHGGKSYLIDGGPTGADMFAFIAELGQALTQTAQAADSPKFDRFQRRVLGALSAPGDRDRLFRTLKDFAASFATYVENSRATVAWGPGRLDAFGMIFNRATSIDLNDPGNSKEPNAPVSYPFLWDTSWHDFVQWNGSAPNGTPIDRLGRNVGEVLGVFAHTEIGRNPYPLFFETSIKRRNLLAIENRLRSLQAPKWPAAFGAPDAIRVKAGGALYASMCGSCHTIAKSGGDRTQKVTLTPLDDVGTDPTMARNAVDREAKTGVLEGVRMPLLLTVPPLAATEKSLNLVAHIATGAILAPLDPITVQGLAADQQAIVADLARKGTASILSGNPMMNDTHGLLGKDLLASFLAHRANRNLLVYKARPLDGIWATGPYLHNGSVRNLRQLLLAPADRETTFKIGSREFDSDNVGFTSAGDFLFDTSKAGNSNAGHDYGVGRLTDEQRQDLLDYLKTL